MTTVQDSAATVPPRPPAGSRTHAPAQSVMIVAAAVTAVLALAAGVVAAYLVFPEPTMWRIAVNLLVIMLAVFPIRGMIRRAGPIDQQAARDET